MQQEEHDIVVRTKLHRPQPPSDYVLRPRLIELLQANPRRAFTLVSAPAGYGKSSLVSSWLEGTEGKVAWLSLDEEDRDLGAFLKYFVAAVRTHSPKACRRTHELLGVAELPPASVLADSLCNELDTLQRRFTLVLDDFHCVDTGEINELVGNLLRHPPRSLHLVVVTRRDPAISFARLRATGGMVEIRESDLRFGREETRMVIEAVSGVAISEESLSHLHSEVEGWIVGLRLVCLALRDRDDPDAYLEKLRGGVNTIQDYLTEEVLAKQSAEFRRCLMESSILNRFCAPLCDAVFGSSSEQATAEAGDGPAMMGGEEFLRRLAEANLFAIGLDPQGDWFRFHHQFDVLLQHQLERHADAGRIAALHLRASAWFEENGIVGEAIEHALAAGDVELATRIIKRCRRAELEEDRWLGMERCLGLLPEDFRNQHAELLMAQAWVGIIRSQMARIPGLISQAELLMADASESDPFLLAELNFFRAVIYYWEDQGEESKRCSEQALEFFCEERGFLGGEVRIYLALARNLCGERAQAIEAIEQDFRMSDATDFAFSTRVVAAKAYLHIFAGDLDPAARVSKQLITIAERWPSRYAETWGHYLLALVRFHTCELDDAAESFRGVMKYRAHLDRRGAVDACCGLLLSYQLMGRSGEAAAVADDFSTFARDLADPEFQQVEASCRARLALLQGDMKTAVG